MKTATALAGGVLLFGSLTACSGGTDAYCEDIAAADDQFSNLEEGDPAEIGGAFAALQQLGEDPPEEVADEWETLNTGLDDLQTALDDAGVSLEDLANASEGNFDPSEIDPEALQRISEAGAELESDEFTEAADAIKEHAESECDVTLGE